METSMSYLYLWGKFCTKSFGVFKIRFISNSIEIQTQILIIRDNFGGNLLEIVLKLLVKRVYTLHFQN